MVKDSKDVISDFNKYVNMTASELETWLKSDDSNSAGWPKDGGDASGESVGHDSGRKIVEILKSNPDKSPDKYGEKDIEHMRKVAAYCKRHLAQEQSTNKNKSEEELKKTKSYASLKNWGHDPLKAEGKSGGTSGKANGAASKSAGGKKGGAQKKDEDGDEKMEDAKQDEEEDKDEAKEEDDSKAKAGDKRKKSGAQNGANKKRETSAAPTTTRTTRSASKQADSGKTDGEKKQEPPKQQQQQKGKQGGNKKKDEKKEQETKKEEEGDDKEEEKEDSGSKSKSKSSSNGPNKGETVSWSWGSGNPKGKVLDVKEGDAEITTKRGNKVSRKGDSKDPAVVLDTGKSKAIKSAHELN